MPDREGLAVRTFTPDRPADVPPVLLVHGFGSDGKTDWVDTGMAAALTAAGRTVIVPDLRGHGATPAPATAGDVTADRCADDLLAVLDAAGAGTVDIVAYSLGARLTWALADAAPGRVRRAVLGGLGPAEPFEAVDVTALHRAVAGEEEPADPFTSFIAGMVRAHGEAAAGLALCVEGLRRTPFRPSPWAGPVAPVLVVGTDDMMVRGTDEIIGVLGAAELVTVSGDHQQVLIGDEFRHTVVKVLAQ
ncbi:alpha/beta fold hydrolase [Streptomyces sp. AM 4-1-1]|uniref:alpha/beta fold hydrolase n=1 Tax=Streptomyces sp. AM 4-1-1 TaxID=3028710 RepID=UPI0023B9DDEF|nr:alpha/beta fold hydrolase [Streptomyces sp. AM 4-1-1]WEH37054.1 alpha/beta fold hydrolase [Streptomyces sp. AM 4-1-1]